MGIFADQVYLDKTAWGFMELEGYELFKIPRRVGIDKIKVVLNIKEINWERLEKAVKAEKELGVQIMKIQSTSGAEDSLRICDGTGPYPWVREILIPLSNKRLSIRRGRFGDKDECTFEVCICPLAGFEYLGNISNNSCEEEKEYMRQRLKEIEEAYGIYFVEGYAGIRHMELNVNFLPQFGMDGLVKRIGPYQAKLTGFLHSTYRTHSEENAIVNREALWKKKLTGMRVTSLVSRSKTRDIDIYDKKEEIIREYDKDWKEGDPRIHKLSALCRIEFTLHRKETIEAYCNKKSNLFELTQEDIENAFKKLATKLLKEPIEGYYREVDDAIEKYFERIDVKDRKWREHLLGDIKELVRGYGVGAYNITKEEIQLYTTYIQAKSVSKNSSRMAKQTIKLFEKYGGKDILLTEKEKEYKKVLEWLCNIDGEEEQELFVLYK